MKKVLVIGSEGQLGQELKSLIPTVDWATFTFTTLDTLDVTSKEQVDAMISENYDFIINCTAYTAVDKAEDDQELANKVNADALTSIGQAAKAIKAKVIHVSTDYVFDGKNHRPYIESDATNPQSVYGKSKLLGEENLINSNPNSIVIRTSWLYSTYGNNFVKTMIRLGHERDELNVIFDQIGTPTYAYDLAKVILHIIQSDIASKIQFTPGVYHYSNEGVASWYDFTLAIHKEKGISCNVKPIETKDYPTPAPRPQYSVLNKAKIKETYQMEIPYWLDSLKQCLKKLNN